MLSAPLSLQGEELATYTAWETVDAYNSDHRIDKQARKPKPFHRLLPRTTYTVVFDQDGTGRRDAPGSDQSWAAIVTGHFTSDRLLPMLLTYCVPFAVAMYSQIQGKRQRDRLQAEISAAAMQTVMKPTDDERSDRM